MGITKVAVIGIGNIGSAHAECIMSKKIDGMELTEVCDIEIEKLKKFKNNVSPDNALPSPFNRPPPVLVSIFMPDVINAIAPVVINPFLLFAILNLPYSASVIKTSLWVRNLCPVL